MSYVKGFLMAEALVALCITIIISSLTVSIVTICVSGNESIDITVQDMNQSYERILEKQGCIEQCTPIPSEDPF